jgi:choline dehydrogenase-like flavoprotein
MMGEEPSNSVVDGYCRSHDVLNLYICSANVFVTSGGGNLTETVTAIAVRMADHMVREGARGWWPQIDDLS